MNRPLTVRRRLLLAGLCAGSWRVAVGQTPKAPFPERAVRFVVPFAPGGGVDITTRLIASRLSWSPPPFIENRAGAGSVIGTEVVARSAPDGHTLLMTATPFTTNAALHPKLPYDTAADFAPVTLAVSAPLIVMVHPSLPIHSIAELITHARARPGQLSFGSSGNGGPQHLGGELFNSMAGTQILHVPYKGSGPATADLLGGHVQIAFGDLLAALAHVKAGRLRAIALTGARRSAVLPDLPTVAEALPGYEATTWFGLLARAGTPASVIRTIHDDVVAVLNRPDVRESLESQGNEIVASSPEALGTFLRAEIDKTVNLAKVASIRIE